MTKNKTNQNKNNNPAMTQNLCGVGGLAAKAVQSEV